MEIRQDWEKPRIMWLTTFKSSNTVRQYDRAIRITEEILGKSLDEIVVEDIRHLLIQFKRMGLSNKSINSILSALSSYYKFVLKNQHEMFGTRIIDINPVASVERPAIDRFDNLDVLNLEQARALIGVGIKEMETGKRLAVGSRNVALILTYLLTGQRSSAVRQLRWGQLRQGGEKAEVQWEWSNAESPWHEFPKPIFTAIRTYLEISGRLAEIKAEDYVFISLESPFEISRPDGGVPPISERMVLRIIQRYAKLAGLRDVTVITLRHTFAAIMTQTGAKPKVIQRQLGLARLDMTKIYLDHLATTDPNHHWQTVSQMLGISPDPESDYPRQRNSPILNGSKQLKRLRK